MNSETKIKKMDDVLLSKIEMMANAVRCGEYSHLVMLCRTLEDEARYVNGYVNSLADEE